MIATGRANTLPPNLVTGVQPTEGKDTPSAYESGILEMLRDIHQWVAPTEESTFPNSYQPHLGLHSSFGEDF